MNVTEWLERTVNTYETDGSTVGRITLVLIESQEVYETWLPPFAAQAIAVEVDSRLRDLENEFSAQVIPLQLIAETSEKNGHRETLSRLPLRLVGKAKKGDGRESAMTAQSVVFDSAVTTIEKLMRLTNTQLDAARLNTDTMNASIGEMVGLIRLYRQREITGEADANNGSALQELIREHGASTLDIIGKLALHHIERK
jgi:hypothetical protein